MSAWLVAGGLGWLLGGAMCGKAEEEAKSSLEESREVTFPTPEQADAIEGYSQVGPC